MEADWEYQDGSGCFVENWSAASAKMCLSVLMNPSPLFDFFQDPCLIEGCVSIKL